MLSRPVQKYRNFTSISKKRYSFRLSRPPTTYTGYHVRLIYVKYTFEKLGTRVDWVDLRTTEKEEGVRPRRPSVIKTRVTGVTSRTGTVSILHGSFFCYSGTYNRNPDYGKEGEKSSLLHPRLRLPSPPVDRPNTSLLEH